MLAVSIVPAHSCHMVHVNYYCFQITQNHVVERLLLHYKTDLTKVMKELRLPYNIEVLTRIRHDCYQQNFSDPNSLQNSQVHVSRTGMRLFSNGLIFFACKCMHLST